jgi:hypothetical protein
MGYCSDVGLCLTKIGKEVLEARVNALEAGNEKTSHIRRLLDKPNGKREDEESGAIAWLWDSIKWYLDYDNVSFIENFLQDLDEEEYLFIRIGASDDDTEIRGGFFDNPFSMNLMRAIYCD